ncbi:MAG: hypothetical protein ACREKB_18530, partial [Candidatus Rokuibacteriota bacterium]
MDTTAKATGTAFDLSVATNVGAAVALNVATITNQATIGSGAEIAAAGITVEAVLRSGESHDFAAWALAAGGGKDTGAAGAVAVNVVIAETTASIGAHAQIDSSGAIVISGNTTTTLQTVAGGAGIGQKAGIGAAVAVNVITVTTLAFIGAGARIDGSEALSLSADSSLTPLDGDLPLDPMSVAAGAGASSGKVGIGGSVVVNVFLLETQAYIDDGALVNTLAAPGTNQGVSVHAEDVTRIVSGAGGLGAATEQLGLGAGIDVAVLDKETRAFIGQNATVKADRDITLEAISEEQVLSIAVAGGFGGRVGIAGSVSVYVPSTTTVATIEGGPSLGSSVRAGGDLT